MRSCSQVVYLSLPSGKTRTPIKLDDSMLAKKLIATNGSRDDVDVVDGNVANRKSITSLKVVS